MRCVLSLHEKCIVVENICKENEDVCKELKGIYGKKDFLREYCAMCIKSIYASRFLRPKVTVVNTL